MLFSPLPRVQGGFPVILIDPPWAYASYSKPEGTVPHRGEVEPYKTIQLNDLKTLPVAEIAAPDCTLFMWAISSHLDQAFPLAAAWGFTYKAKVFEWLKTTKDGDGMRMGMGKWSRQESETILLFTRGSPKRISAGVRSTFYEAPRGHSEKPEQSYERIEALVAGPYCELFARKRRPRWISWGDELPDDSYDARVEMTFWMDLLGVAERPDGGYQLCEVGHPKVGKDWPYCNSFCIPF